MVLDTLTYHPTLAHYLRFASTTVGRDKVLRTLQYLARFLTFYLHRKGYSAAAIVPWEAVKKNFGITRKAMRIGKNIEHLKAASVILDKKDLTPAAKYLSAGRQLAYAGYLTFDTLGFLGSTKMLTYEPATQKRFQRYAQKLWFSGISLSLLHSVYKLQQLATRAESVIKTDPEGRLEAEKIRKEKAAVHTQMLQDGCDWIIPATGLGYFGFDEGVIGAAGIVSSWLGLRAQWAKTA